MWERFGMPRLPPELDNQVISFLHSDPDALRRCSLVCKDWLSTSRLYYPGTLSIDKDNVQALTCLLSHPLSTFDKSYSMVEIWVDRSDPRKGNREVNVLDVLAVHLHKIKTRFLVLSGGDQQTPVQVRREYEDALLNWLVRITDLRLIDIELHHPDNFYTFCPLLERLTFVTIMRRRPYAIGRQPLTKYPRHLHTIRISFEWNTTLPLWLGLSLGCRPIDRLELYTWHRCIPLLFGFLTGRSELPVYTLYVALRMDSTDVFSPSVAHRSYWRQLDICLSQERFTELRSVHIHLWAEPSDFRPDPLSRIRGLMPDLESRKILELSLSFLSLKSYIPQNWDVRLLDHMQDPVNF